MTLINSDMFHGEMLEVTATLQLNLKVDLHIAVSLPHRSLAGFVVHEVGGADKLE